MERAVKMTRDMIRDANGERGVQKLDGFISSLNGTRQSERLAFPMATFPQGVSNVTTLQGQEFPALILQLMAVLAAGYAEEEMLPREKTQGVLKALDALYRLWLKLEMDSHDVDEIAEGGPLEEQIKRYGRKGAGVD